MAQEGLGVGLGSCVNALVEEAKEELEVCVKGCKGGGGDTRDNKAEGWVEANRGGSILILMFNFLDLPGGS